jgi:hypothetical protein
MKRSARLLIVVVLVLFQASAASGSEGLVPQSVRGRTPASAHLDSGSRSRQAPSLTSLSHDGLSRMFVQGEIDAATCALERVRSLFSSELLGRNTATLHAQIRGRQRCYFATWHETFGT